MTATPPPIGAKVRYVAVGIVERTHRLSGKDRLLVRWPSGLVWVTADEIEEVQP